MFHYPFFENWDRRMRRVETVAYSNAPDARARKKKSPTSNENHIVRGPAFAR